MGGLDLQAIAAGFRSALSSNAVTLVVLALCVFALLRSPLWKRLARVVEDMFFTNWRLGLLAATGLVLSAASGWTTWDGMRNFTGEPILSAMVTFGIQGVMLIVAWLIGESFATGMTQQTSNGIAEARNDASLKVAIGFLMASILVGAVALLFGWGDARSVDPKLLAGVAAGIGLVGLFIIASKTTTLRGYFDAMRVMVRSAVLWVMFLACMATSVFFSFDSLFSTIFPQEERKRAAELRAQNQVAGVVADIGSLISTRQLSEAEALFATKGWAEYDKQLQELARAAGGSQREIETYFTSLMEQRRRAVAEQQERIATAQSSQAGLANKKSSLTDELARLKSERPGLLEEVKQRRETVEATTKELDAKRVEAMAEEKGVEGTGKIGRGAIFRQRKAEEDALRDKLKIAEERLREPQRRLQVSDQRIVQIERELSTIDGDLAKLKGETQTAESRIKLAEDAKATEEGALKVDPTRMLPAFERARQEFRQSPRAEGLAELQRQCAQLLGAMTATPATKAKVAGIDCDPKSASEAAARVFALNDGIKTFGASCAGGDKLVQYKSADALFDFARRCVQDSGLASKDTDDLRQKVNFIELNRDDKANRFVVTWNAFNDGNRLAYLALAIAIAIDSLVFMSGLFGANAVRSPLSDVPTTKARSAEQLEGIIDNALLPHRFENARITIEAMHADTSRPGYSAVVEMGDLDPERRLVVAKVMNAGATINAVHRDERDPRRYFVRPELFEYLSIAGNRAFEKNGDLIKENIEEKIKLAQLEKDISVALVQDGSPNASKPINQQIADGAEVVLDRLHPYPDPEDTGYRSELRIVDFQEHPADFKIARRVLTVGSNMRLVEIPKYKDTARDKDSSARPLEGHYLLHTDFVKTLTRLRARMLLSTSSAAAQLTSDARQGGALHAQAPQLGANPRPTSQLPAPDARDAGQPRTNSLPAAFAQPQSAAPQRPEEPTSPPTTAPDTNELTRSLIEHFAEHMGRSFNEVEYYFTYHAFVDATSLENALGSVLNYFGGSLAGQIREAKAALQSGIDDAYNALPDALMQASPQAPLLAHDVRRKLQDMKVAIILANGGAYRHVLDKMHKELMDDEVNGRLSPTQISEFHLLTRHRRELAEADNGETWDRIVRSLMKYHAGLTNLGARQSDSLM